MEHRELLICKCHSPEHQIIFSWDDDLDETLVYMTIHLNKHGFWQRLKYGIKYIFGRQCNYGAFDEVILNPEDARKVYSIYTYLNQPNVRKIKGKRFYICWILIPIRLGVFLCLIDFIFEFDVFKFKIDKSSKD